MILFFLKKKVRLSFFINDKINPNKKIEELIIRLILKKKWIVVTINVIITNPKNMSKKKLSFILKFINFPYPDIDKENKKILI